MSDSENILNSQQELNRLSRKGLQETTEKAIVTMPGDRSNAFAIVVNSCANYNVYNVQMVEVGPAGTLPVEICQEVEAVNLAEPFLQQGQLPSWTYSVMFRAGEKNVFYAKV
ncbi:MAG: hypothetical protein KAI59_04155 [Planctomycetes bacterium]|nr:hypothetical protein [Planctomycetota bacterium]MCK5473201.1 hypothetical protein [Planctomycetota bacterium]